MFTIREIKEIAVMKKCTAFALIVGLFLPATPLLSAGVCDLLQTGDVSVIAKPTPFDPPDITSMPIQVYSTVDLNTVLELKTPPTTLMSVHCAIASDLMEVDIMMEDVGFGGYGGTNSPLVESARLKYVATQTDRNFLRALARALMYGDAEAEGWLLQLKANPALYKDRALNIYFVTYDHAEFQLYDEDAAPFEIKGMHLRDEDGETEKMIFYGLDATPTTLSHEFGHAFSNGHVNFFDLDGTEWCAKFLPHNKASEELGVPPKVDMVCEFDRLNYMWAGSTADRQALGDPQKERMRRNMKSIMYQFQEDPNPLDCPDYSSDPTKNCERLLQ